MNKIKSIINSQKTAIILLLILNLLQLREIGLLRMELDRIMYKLEKISLRDNVLPKND
mgnify:CR=1 FL=1